MEEHKLKFVGILFSSFNWTMPSVCHDDKRFYFELTLLIYLFSGTSLYSFHFILFCSSAYHIKNKVHCEVYILFVYVLFVKFSFLTHP